MLRKLSSSFLDIIETLVIGLSIFLVVYLFLLQPHQVNGQSMVPNFHNGDYLLTDKISYRVGDPQRGDVIVFHAPASANCPKGTGCDFIKRILGVPGDQVEVHDNAIWINGAAMPELYLPADIRTEAGAYTQGKRLVLGPNEFFAVGDNRQHSSDSRAWGPVNRSEIVGRAFVRYWPISSIGWIAPVKY